MIDALISGKLHGVAEQRTGKSGRPFTTCRLRAAAGEGEALFVSVVAFSETVQATLLALGDGDTIVLGGQLTPKAWTDKEGNARPGADLVANVALSVYHARRRRDAVQARAESDSGQWGVEK